MGRPRLHTDQDISNEALKHNNRTDFKNAAPGMFEYARKNKYLNKICKHMKHKNIKWSRGAIEKEVEKYSSRASFMRESPGAYGAAIKLNILQEILYTIDSKIIKWNYEMLAVTAMRFKTRTEFEINAHKAYYTAKHRGILNDICSHMDKTTRGFNPNIPAILYYFKIKETWKIGITNKTVKARYNKEDYKNITNLQTWQFEKGIEAREYETNILRKYRKFKYNGTSPFTGNTGTAECFYTDVQKLE